MRFIDESSLGYVLFEQAVDEDGQWRHGDIVEHEMKAHQ